MIGYTTVGTQTLCTPRNRDDKFPAACFPDPDGNQLCAYTFIRT